MSFGRLPFTCTSEFGGLAINKEKSKFVVTCTSKNLWIPTPLIEVKYKFQKNTFKPDSTMGSLVVTGPGLSTIVESVDTAILNQLKTMYSGKVLGNIVMSDDALKKMFKPSLSSGNLRVNLDPKSCTFFKSDASLIPTPTFDSLETFFDTGDTVRMVIEPAFAWIMNKQIGVHWDARQIKMIPKTSPVAAKRSMLLVPNTISDGGGTECVEGSTVTKKSFLRLDSSEEEGVAIVKKKVLKKKKCVDQKTVDTVGVTKKSFLKLDSDTDVDTADKPVVVQNKKSFLTLDSE